MNQLFFDATYIGKLHWREPGSAEVLTCAATADELVCSLHGRAEFYAMGFRKVREGLAAPSTVQAVFAQFNADVAAGDIRLLLLTEAIVDRVESVFATAPATGFSNGLYPKSKFLGNRLDPPGLIAGCFGPPNHRIVWR